ncbi:Profilin/allergen [Backusella circina FSU 941]|nr:Profilin/allergen [Backusella circina FSU 941]
MSWQAYVDTNLVGTGKVSQGVIFGLSGGVWASSPGFTVQPNEIQEIIKGFADNDSVRANGVHVNGTKYLTLSADGRSIYGKKGSTGCCLVKTTQAVLVAIYNDKIQPGECTKVTEGLADYLISVGY